MILILIRLVIRIAVPIWSLRVLLAKCIFFIASIGPMHKSALILLLLALDHLQQIVYSSLRAGSLCCFFAMAAFFSTLYFVIVYIYSMGGDPILTGGLTDDLVGQHLLRDHLD